MKVGKWRQTTEKEKGRLSSLFRKVGGPVEWLCKDKDLIKVEIEDYLDHKNLNVEVEEFKSLNPTAENIAVVIWKRLRSHIQKSHELEVVLYETPRNYVTFSG